MDSDRQIKPTEHVMPTRVADHFLEAGQELRISRIQKHKKVIMQEGGQADVFGKEIPPEEPVFFH